nr:lithostathine-1-beta-like [Anolis sagrei ordinatus]
MLSKKFNEEKACVLEAVHLDPPPLLKGLIQWVLGAALHTCSIKKKAFLFFVFSNWDYPGSLAGARDRSLLRPRSPCPAGTLYSRNVCYEYLEEEVTWQDAEDYCQFWRAGHLASIQSDKEENIISKYIKQTNSPSRVWIGFHATPVSSKLKWGWADGFAYPPGSALWDNRKPSTTLSSSRCAALCNVQHPTGAYGGTHKGNGWEQRHSPQLA